MILLIFFIVLISIIMLQIQLCKCKNKYLGLIIPTIISIPISVLVIMFSLLASQDVGLFSIILAILGLVIYNIPSVLLYLLYRKFHI